MGSLPLVPPGKPSNRYRNEQLGRSSFMVRCGHIHFKVAERILWKKYSISVGKKNFVYKVRLGSGVEVLV